MSTRSRRNRQTPSQQKRRSQRPGPATSAAESRVGSTATGNDGQLYRVAQSVQGTHRWVKITRSETKMKMKTKTKTKTKSGSRNIKGETRIEFTEPCTSMAQGFQFSVPLNFLAILSKAPKKVSDESRSANAYIFGKQYPLKEYKKIGDHGNDAAQTGFVNVDLMKKSELKTWKEDPWKEVDRLGWDSRDGLRTIQKSFPWIIWYGETLGGDVGASLYAHYDKSRKIDSLIVNIRFFWPGDESDEFESKESFM